MDLSERILTKTEINSRVVDALLAIVHNEMVATKSDLAERLGTKPAKFSEILNYRMNAGVDIIAKICDWYSIDPYWLLMGRGNKIFRDTKLKLPPYNIDDDLDREFHLENDDTDLDERNQEPISNTMAEMFYQKTLEQAEEIGRLREQIEQLKKMLKKTASNANISDTANAG